VESRCDFITARNPHSRLCSISSRSLSYWMDKNIILAETILMYGLLNPQEFRRQYTGMVIRNDIGRSFYRMTRKDEKK
jgi:hypothetical protein